MTLRNSEEQLKKRFEALAGERLPLWEDIPDLELYMDQVVSIVTDGLLPFNITESDIVLTPSMVNNYVKKKVMPATSKNISPPKPRFTARHPSLGISQPATGENSIPPAAEPMSARPIAEPVFP